MITLIHGDDIAASRNYYFELKQKFPDNTILNGAVISQTDLQQSLSGSNLFGDIPHIFIDELISKRKSPKEIETLIGIINSSQADITLWESKELTAKQVTTFTKPTIKVFKVPSTIFAFLDAIKPNNNKQLIELFHKTLEDKDPEFVLFMLTRLARTLLAFVSGHSRAKQSETIESQRSYQGLQPFQDDNHVISEVSRLAPWQKGKLEIQAKLFTSDQLINLHGKLFQLELDMKTGGLTLPLAESLDLLLLSL